jgi:hypothetical protein
MVKENSNLNDLFNELFGFGIVQTSYNPQQVLEFLLNEEVEDDNEEEEPKREILG